MPGNPLLPRANRWTHLCTARLSVPACAIFGTPKRHSVCVKASSLQAFQAMDFEIERLLGSLGYLTVSSYRPEGQLPKSDEGNGLGLDLDTMQRLGGQSFEEGTVAVKLYQAVCRKGPLSGTRVILKAYPLSKSGSEADAMAANELRAFASLQPPVVPDFSDNVCKLLGAFMVGTAGAGEQWLVFKNDGVYTAEQYARAAAEAFEQSVAVGEGEFWDRFSPERPLERRRLMVLRILRGALEGLAFMHARNWLHQSLGPTSIAISEIDESQSRFLRVRVRDLAFAVDVTDSTMLGGSTLAELWEGSASAESTGPSEIAEALWSRARVMGASTALERRAFGKADDVYAAGLLVLYLCFVPFANPGDIDGAQLQRLVESTFRLDMEAFREFAEADDRWEAGCKFLAMGDGAGWDLVSKMLDRDWRKRPSAQECLEHPFLTGKALAPR